MPKEKTDAWKDVQTRALAVTGSDVANFPWCPVDLKIAQCMLSGFTSVRELAAEVGIGERALKHRLLDPVRCAWISSQLEKCVGDRLGQVVAAVYNRAVRTGDPQAATLLLKQYKKFMPERKEIHHTHHMDLSNLSDGQIDKLIEQKKRNLNVMDADYKVKETPKDAERGEESSISSA